VATGAFALKPIPWPAGALAPIISARTVQLHHWHYAKCVRSANQLARQHRELADKSALDIVRWAREHARDSKLFAASSEAWNHEQLWHSLTPLRLRPDGELARAMDGAFGSYSEFAAAFALAGAAHVGSGWLWLVANRRKQVRIVTTANTDSPEYRGSTCLLAVDLWEHAYYFDHQTNRLKYLRAVIDSRLDWTFAAARYDVAMARSAAVRPARKSRRDQDRSPADDNIRRPHFRPQSWLRH
jgi:Fe-Mn family superoxide dismutase